MYVEWIIDPQAANQSHATIIGLRCNGYPIGTENDPPAMKTYEGLCSYIVLGDLFTMLSYASQETQHITIHPHRALSRKRAMCIHFQFQHIKNVVLLSVVADTFQISGLSTAESTLQKTDRRGVFSGTKSKV